MRGNMALIRGAVVALGLVVGLGGGAASAESGRWLKRPSDGVWEWHAGNPRVFADLNADGWVDAADLGLMVGLLSEQAPRVAEVREGDAPADLRVRADVNVSGEIDEKDLTLLLDALAFGAPIRGGGCPPDDRPPPCGNGGGSDDGGGLDGPPGGSDGFGSGGFGSGGSGGGTDPGGTDPGGGGEPGCAFQLVPWCDPSMSSSAVGLGWLTVRAVADGEPVEVDFDPIEGVTVEPSGCGYRVSAETPGEYVLYARRTQGEDECAAGITIEIRELDLDIDSDNDNDFDIPDLDPEEDEVEDEGAGRIVLANRGNVDEDFFIDFVDGYDRFPNADEPSYGMEFVPVLLYVRGMNPATTVIRIEYDDSHPLIDVAFSADGWLIDGRARLWLKNGEATRNGASVAAGGDYVASGDYTLDMLEPDPYTDYVMLFLETLVPSDEVGDLVIEAQIDQDGDGVFDSSDRVRVTSVWMEFYNIDGYGDLELPAMMLTPTEEYDTSATELPWPEVIDTFHQPVVYEARLYDPRDLSEEFFTVGEERLSLQPRSGYWASEAFWLDDPPHYLNPGIAKFAGGTPRRVLIEDDIEWEFDDPSSGTRSERGRNKRLKIPPATQTDKMLQAAQARIVDAMKADGSWIANYAPNDPGAFGTEVHRRLAIELHGRKRWVANVWIDLDASRTIRAINSPATPPGVNPMHVGEIDLLRLKPGHSLAVGESFSIDKIQDGNAVFEIKTSSNGRIDTNQVNKYIFFTGSDRNFRVSVPSERFLRGPGWQPHPDGARLIRIQRMHAVAPLAISVLTVAFPQDARAAQAAMFANHRRAIEAILAHQPGSDSDMLLFLESLNDYLFIKSGVTIPNAVGAIAVLHATNRILERQEAFHHAGIPVE